MDIKFLVTGTQLNVNNNKELELKKNINQKQVHIVHVDKNTICRL